MTTDIVAKEVTLSDVQGKAMQQFEDWFNKARMEYRGQRITDDEGEYQPFADGSVSQVFKIFGFAGTGKTTLAARKAQELGGGILAATFTGKASLVMRRKGFNCSTIHSLIYKPEMLPVLDDKGQPTGEEELSFVLNQESDLWLAKLLIVDEVSMVNEEIARDLLAFNRPILVLGDPGQLPPVGGTGYFIKGKPDVMLTEIHRQALDNPIIRMSMDIRTGRGVRTGVYGSSKVVTKAQFNRSREQDILAADQILCGTNRTRRTLNAQARGFKGFELMAQPMVGDKLICLRNSKKKNLFNGGMWKVAAPPQFDGEVYEMRLNSLDIQGHTADVEVPMEFFIGEEEKLPGSKRRKYEEFDFGEAITVHKAQGSQYDNVLLYNENHCFRDYPIQHLYSGITRAAETLTLVI